MLVYARVCVCMCVGIRFAHGKTDTRATEPCMQHTRLCLLGEVVGLRDQNGPKRVQHADVSRNKSDNPIRSLHHQQVRLARPGVLPVE